MTPCVSHAQTAVLQAQLDTLRQDLRVAVMQASLAIKAAQAARLAADELVQLARERVALAEGRYQTGVRNTIELGDAELSLRDAQTQRVTAEYDPPRGLGRRNCQRWGRERGLAYCHPVYVNRRLLCSGNGPTDLEADADLDAKLKELGVREGGFVKHIVVESGEKTPDIA